MKIKYHESYCEVINTKGLSNPNMTLYIRGNLLYSCSDYLKDIKNVFKKLK